MGKSINSHTSFWSLKATESMLFLLALAFFIACGDDSSNNSNGAEGGMESCTVVKSADSTSYTLKCPDGTQVEIRDGKNGTAGKNGVSDTSASKGAGCTVKELDGGSVSLECPDGTKLVFGEDGKVAGKGASSSGTSLSSNSKVGSSSGKSGSSSSANPSGNSSSSQAVAGKTQGYVQFNRDRYETISEVAGAGIYLIDEDNMASTATVTVYADSPDSLQLTLERQDQYFYAPLPVITYGDNSDRALYVDSVSKLIAKYMDPSTGVAKYDSATVNLQGDTVFTGGACSISFGRRTYYDLDDRAVITYRNDRLFGVGVILVKAYSNVDTGRYIPLYPVAGGDPHERIGFVGFTLGTPADGEIKVEDGTLIGAVGDSSCMDRSSYGDYYVESASATWEMSEFFGMTCSKDGNLVNGIKYPDRQYVCDDGEFRVPSNREISQGKGCTSYNRKDKISGHTCFRFWYADSIAKNMSTFVDARDGREYSTVKIGTQVWMAENLNYATENSYCNEDTDRSCTKYGRLYTWAAAETACPSGYHLPNATEWNGLFDAVGGKDTAAEVLESRSGGEDSFGFSVLPANVNDTDFWSSSESGSGYAYYVHFGFLMVELYLDYGNKDNGHSIRCLKD